MAEFIRARINEDWARSLVTHEGAFEIWRYNRTNAEELGRELDLSLLGGLVIGCSERIYNATDAPHYDIAKRGQVINLAFGENAQARITDTARLMWDAEGTLAEQLEARLEASSDRFGANEVWLLPVAALELVEQ